jgi:hypothetical protein
MSLAAASQTTETTVLEPDLLDHLLDTVSLTDPTQDTDPAFTEALSRDAARMFIRAMNPTDPFQAMLAVQIVAAHQAIMNAFRAAKNPEIAPALAARLRANAVAVGRMQQATIRTLRELQAPEPEQTAPTATPPTRATRPTRRTATVKITPARLVAETEPKPSAIPPPDPDGPPPCDSKPYIPWKP